MGNILYWFLASIVYGLLCGGIYTWMWSKKKGTWRGFAISTAIFSAFGLLIVWILYRLFN